MLSFLNASLVSAADTMNSTVSLSEYNLAVGLSAGLGVFLALLVGFAIGWYIAMRMFKKQIKENPPITEKQVRDLYTQMGRKPSEKQVKQIMNQFKKKS